MAAWEYDSEINYYDINFNEIVKFFVFESPVKDTSVRGYDFNCRGIKGNHVKKLTNTIEDRLPEFFENWDTDIIDNLEDRYAAIGMLDDCDFSMEFALHYVKDGLNPTTGLYYFVRCALAHGCFSIHDVGGIRYYMMENLHDGNSKGRAVLKESSLKTLISVVDEVTNMLTQRK